MSAAVTLHSVSEPILLFDGVCNLCNGLVQWVIARDAHARFRFASLQSDAGRALLAQHGLPPDGMDTVVLVEGAEHWRKSDAALQVLRRLGAPWRWLFVLRFVPRRLRDAGYDALARRRYGWWGRREECWLPTPELRARFL